MEPISVTIVYPESELFNFSFDEREKYALSDLLSKAVKENLISFPDRHPYSDKYCGYEISFYREDRGNCFGMAESTITMYIKKKK